MIIIKKGNMFDSECQTIVNPVNCVGIMGAGLASEFKKRYPQIMKPYLEICNSGYLKPGVLHNIQVEENKQVLLFPTKDEYWKTSRIEYIEQGLDFLIENYMEPLSIHSEVREGSIAFPALGCGLGGLKWKYVKELMIEKLNLLPIKIEIYEGGN